MFEKEPKVEVALQKVIVRRRYLIYKGRKDEDTLNREFTLDSTTKG